jgi:hypothetical protein
MADLPYIQEALEVKITGQNATGNTVNYVGADANGNLTVIDESDGPVSPGTVALVSSLAGGQFNTANPALTNTQQAALQINQFGALSISQRNKYKNLTGNATITIKSGTGVLQSIMINNPGSSGTVILYDNTAGSGTIIATLTISSGGVNPVPNAMSNLGLEFTTGLTVVTAGSTTNNFTIVYQ